jgi:hypothetical protein
LLADSCEIVFSECGIRRISSFQERRFSGAGYL